MKIHNVVQGTSEWLAVRCGMPTASRFDVLMTAKARKGELTAGSQTYRNHLLIEWITGTPLDERGTAWMDRGTTLEPEAIAAYEFDRGVTVVPIGFCELESPHCGCSPDGFIGSDGLIEAKCFSLENHIAALLEADDAHQAQVQGNLWITGRQWCDRVYYNPILPPVTVRFERDDDYIAELSYAVEAFTRHLAEAKAKLLSLGCKPKGT